jgi:uncharacterized protein
MLFLDTSALMKRYVDEEGTPLVLARMEADPAWVASAIAHVEATIALCGMGFDAAQLEDRQRRLDEDWQRCLVVPVDFACLQQASDIGCRHGVRTMDAVHLAAAMRLPPPFTLLTFDRRQAEAARALGLDARED